jgi:hypothetical protein
LRKSHRAEGHAKPGSPDGNLRRNHASLDHHYLANRVEWARVGSEGFGIPAEKEDFHTAWVASGEHLAALLKRRDEIRKALEPTS